MAAEHPRLTTPWNYDASGACYHLSMSDGARTSSHSRQDLANFVKVNAQRLDPSLIARFTELTDAMVLGAKPVDYFLGLLEPVLDDLFFGGRIRGRCFMIFSPMSSTQTHYLAITRPLPTPGKTCIVMCTRDSGVRGEDRIAALRGYVATLLHEMVHAYLLVYECASCLAKDLDEGARDPGHGSPWTEIVEIITKATSDHLGLPLNLRFGKQARIFDGR